MLLAILGVMTWSANGIIVDQRASTFNELTNTWSYEDVTYDTTNPLIYSFVAVSTLLGSVLTMVSMLGGSAPRKDLSFHY